MMTRFLTAGVLIPLVLVSLFRGPLWCFLLLGSLFQGAALWEFLSLVPHYGARPLWILPPLGLGLPWVWNYSPHEQLPCLVAAGLILLFASLLTRSQPRTLFLTACLNLLGFFYLGLPFSLIGSLHPEAPAGRASGYELLLVLGSVWICDSAAFFFGRAFGKHRITPRISPGKSLEGFVAGFSLSAVFTLFLAYRVLHWSWAVSLALALLLPLASILGDLFESALKRGAGVKDTSQLIPGHGGVLDRIDSLLFALPSYYVVSSLLY